MPGIGAIGIEVVQDIQATDGLTEEQDFPEEGDGKGGEEAGDSDRAG
ncbi:MAG: hypothetical protein ACYDAG_00855 [Chloroflexota bacterium]